MEELRKSDEEYEKEQIANWFAPPTFAEQHSDITGRRQPGTGQWLLDSAKYQAWTQGKNCTLLCPGISGAGKTMMAAIVINDLQQQFEVEKHIIVIYLYCDFK